VGPAAAAGEAPPIRTMPDAPAADLPKIMRGERGGEQACAALTSRGVARVVESAAPDAEESPPRLVPPPRRRRPASHAFLARVLGPLTSVLLDTAGGAGGAGSADAGGCGHLLSGRERRNLASLNRTTAAVARTLAAAHAHRPAHPAVGFTHEGGEGGMGKENQDAWFIERPSRDLSIFAVFDGHGKRFGKLAGEVASRTLSRYLRHLHRWATHEPEAALSWCFRRAHDDIRQAMLTEDPGAKIKLQRGIEAFLLEYMPSPDGDGFQVRD